MSRKISFIAMIAAGGSLGLLSSLAGYPISTWQYWVFTIPAVTLLGAMWEHPSSTKGGAS